MSSTLNRWAWRKTLVEDLEWLEALPHNQGPASELGHVIMILRSLVGVSPAAYEKFIESEQAARAVEAHLDRVDPDRSLSRRWEELKKELALRLSYGGPDPDPEGTAKIAGAIEELMRQILPAKEAP